MIARSLLVLVLSLPIGVWSTISCGPWEGGSTPTLILEWNSNSELEASATLSIPPGTSSIKATLQILEEQLWNTNLKPQFSEPTFSAPLRYRDVTVSTLQWNPFRVMQGQTFFVTRARLTVQFVPGNTTPRRSFAGLETDPAENYLRTWLINYAQSRQFRHTPPLAKIMAPLSVIPPIRMVVFTQNETIERISGAELRKAGLPYPQVDPRTIRMYKSGMEIPIFVQGGEDGRLDAGDFIEFIGARSTGLNTYLSPYTNEAAFYLTWGKSGSGLRVPAVPVTPQDKKAPVIPPYRVSAHIEEDKTILRIGSTAAQDISDLGGRVTEDKLSDFWFWIRMGVEKDLIEVPFFLPYSPSINLGTTAIENRPVMRIELKGITNNLRADPDHHLRFLLNGIDISLVNGVRRDAIWEGQNSITWISDPLPSSALKAGSNVLTMVRVNDLFTTDGKPVENQDAFLNSIKVVFKAQTIAVNDAVRFSNTFPDSLGPKHFRLESFQSPNISLWDKRGRKLVGFEWRKQGSGYQADFEDSLISPVEYIAVGTNALEKPQLRLDTLPELMTPNVGADLIIITHRSLYGSALDSLVRRRKSQNLRVKVVDIFHVFQQFGEGVTDPAAIRRFTEWAYTHWPRPAPLYVLLIGETSDWFDKLTGSLQRNLVPTHLVNIAGWGIAAADDYFGRVSGEDGLSDLSIGRIPVNTPAELSAVVEKIIRLEERPPGAWNNKTHLLGGYEAAFTTGQNRLQTLATQGDRPPTRIDLYPPSPYYKAPSQRVDFYRQLDSAFNLVSFFGHGGGAVWSDAGILTLEALDKDSLRGEYPIPLISSITCLTGYFEDVADRSLGEEMLRRPKNGATGFYGASGYISTTLGHVLAGEILAAATISDPSTLGGIVLRAETQVQLKTGNNFLPVLAEFNLLGDPSMPYGYSPQSGTLEINPKLLGNDKIIEVSGNALKIPSGQGTLSVIVGDSVAMQLPLTISNSGFKQSLQLPGLLPIFQIGKVIAHVWNSTGSAVYSGAFSGLDWMIDSLQLVPQTVSPGDSVNVRFILRSPTVLGSGNGLLSYSVSGDIPNAFPSSNVVGLLRLGRNGFVTANRFKVPFPGVIGDPLMLQINLGIRLNLSDSLGNPLGSVNSKTYSFPINPVAHMGIVPSGFTLPIQDSLGVWIRYRNSGMGINGKGEILLIANPDTGIAWQKKVPAKKGLKLGQIDSVFISILDSNLSQTLRAVYIPENPAELNPISNAQDSNFHLWTTLLRTVNDSLAPWFLGPTFRLASGKPARRIFIGDVPISLPPFLSVADSTPLAGRGFFLTTKSPENTAIKIVAPKRWIDGVSNSDASWHYSKSTIGPWLKLDTAYSGTSTHFQTGYYGFFRNSDHSPPRITIHSRGQNLLLDDYIPRDTPIEVLIEDPSGIDLDIRKPVLLSGFSGIDSTTLVIERTMGLPTLARLQFKPKITARDSITILAYDAAGNLARKDFTYRIGEKFAIRNLGAYPNPFADTTIFVFDLTDFTDEVTLRIYSRAGRTVHTMRERHVVGYREIIWDGRNHEGKPIANGLYYLKATAKSGSKSSEATFKLFKKKY